MITIVTTTRNRPEAFALLEKWMRQQTLQPDQWIVVNDGVKPYHYTMQQKVIKRVPQADERHSLCENWLEALPWIIHDRVLIWEDDDYYHPRFNELLNAELAKGFELVGVREDIYYHVHSRAFKRMHNQSLCSLACTGFVKSLRPLMKVIAQRGQACLDSQLWAEQLDSKSTLANNYQGKVLHLGMKGSQSQCGIGVGHYTTNLSKDIGFQQLRKWLGPDAKPYIDIVTKKLAW